MNLPLPPDPDQVNILVDNLAKIVTGATLIFLALLRFLGRGKQAEQAKVVLTETPVSHAELLECQIGVNKLIREQFEHLREELRTEIKDLHKRIDRES